MEEICERLRQMYGIDDYPVDVHRLAERKGVKVRERAWQGGPHAICVVELRLVILNRRRSETQRRFDLAHELGHFVLPESSWHTDAENRFASCLLMPKQIFQWEWLAALGHAARVAHVFGVSQTAVLRRKYELTSIPVPFPAKGGRGTQNL